MDCMEANLQIPARRRPRLVALEGKGCSRSGRHDERIEYPSAMLLVAIIKKKSFHYHGAGKDSVILSRI